MPKVNRSAFTLIELSIVLIIIGLLASGVIAGKLLIDKAKLASARAATKSSVVPQIENLVLWLDAASEESLRDNNDNIIENDGVDVKTWSNINPQRGSKNDATQTDPDDQPTYRTSAFNGLPTLEFDGSEDWLDLSDSLINPQYESITLFVVAKLFTTNSKYNQPFIATMRYNNNSDTIEA